MLVLSRKVSQQIVVDGPCVITVTNITGNRAKIGIEAAPEVGVRRVEIEPREKEEVK